MFHSKSSSSSSSQTTMSVSESQTQRFPVGQALVTALASGHKLGGIAFAATSLHLAFWQRRRTRLVQLRISGFPSLQALNQLTVEASVGKANGKRRAARFCFAQSVRPLAANQLDFTFTLFDCFTKFPLTTFNTDFSSKFYCEKPKIKKKNQ